MQVSSISSLTSVGDAPPATGAAGAAGFESALLDADRQAAAADVLARLPAPIVYTLRDRAGSPVEAVDRLFEVLRDGSFVPPEGPLGAPHTIIGATARAAALFESPQQLWDAMRTAISEPARLRVALAGLPPGDPPEVAGPPPPPIEGQVGVEVEGEVDVEVTSADQALALLGARPAPTQTAWWEAALLFLLGPEGLEAGN